MLIMRTQRGDHGVSYSVVDDETDEVFWAKEVFFAGHGPPDADGDRIGGPLFYRAAREQEAALRRLQQQVED